MKEIMTSLKWIISYGPLMLLLLASCVANSRPDPRDLQSRIIARATSESEMRETFAALMRLPVTENGNIWVQVVNDVTRPRWQQQYAFAAFWARFLRPGSDLSEVCRIYALENWFRDDDFGDWTNSDNTPFDDKWPETRDNGVFFLLLKRQDKLKFRAEDDAFVSFSTEGKCSIEDVIQAVNPRLHKKLRVTHVWVTIGDSVIILH
jgi:hypothetical protein